MERFKDSTGMWEGSSKSRTKLEFVDTIIRIITVNSVSCEDPSAFGSMCETKVYQWYNTIPTSLLPLSPFYRQLLHPSRCFIVDTSAECLSCLNNTLTSVEIYSSFGMCRCTNRWMWKDARARGARRRARHVTRHDAYTFSLSSRETDNNKERDMQTEESP